MSRSPRLVNTLHSSHSNVLFDPRARPGAPLDLQVHCHTAHDKGFSSLDKG